MQRLFLSARPCQRSFHVRRPWRSSTIRCIGSPATAFVDQDNVDAYHDDHIVSVGQHWSELLQHLSCQKLALLIAPPRSGKSLLGQLAARGRVASIDKSAYLVRYVSDVRFIGDYLSRWNESRILDAAYRSEDSSMPKIVYYFDEAHELPGAVYDAFVKSPRGCAIFATTGTANLSKYPTPAELVKNSFFLWWTCQYGAAEKLASCQIWFSFS